MNARYILLRPAKTEESGPEQQIGLLSSFLSIGKRKFTDFFLLRPAKTLSFEVASINQKTRFYITPPNGLSGYFSSQVLSQYPKTLIEKEKVDPLLQVMKGKRIAVSKLELSYSFQYPLSTFNTMETGQPLSALLGFLSKLQASEAAFIQIVVKAPFSQDTLQKAIRLKMKQVDSEGKEHASPYNALISDKLKASLLEVQIRCAFASDTADKAHSRLNELVGIFGVYTRSEGNAFVPKIVEGFGKKRLIHSMAMRSFLMFAGSFYLNLDEIASLWYLPGSQLLKIKGILWGKTYVSESPDNLPVSGRDEQRHNINFFARTEWRNREEVFGIKKDDRRKHMYIIGKTGAGKSTLIANMAINDIRNGEGVAVIDPHGDLSEMILDYIPKRRINDVVYLDPTLSSDRAFSLNLFDQDGIEHTDVIASGIISVFYKLYYNSWGPRLEYLLRNTILSLLYSGGATFGDIPRVLTNKKYRKQVFSGLGKKNSTLADFWDNEYEKMGERLRAEAISPILNKVGQFLSAERIRSVVDNKKSTFSFERIMDRGQILILNLSQGKLGEDTTALLGAMFITKIQLTAMKRVHQSEQSRRDFYLYVDEFQNFATNSFIKILSEARKYKLNLSLANQYIGQVEEDVQKAIFGNVGTLATFVVGSRDALLFQKEFGGVFSADDLVSLGKYEIVLKMSIDGLTSSPFIAKTLPPPSVVNNNREKIIRRCLSEYYRKK